MTGNGAISNGNRMEPLPEGFKSSTSTDQKTEAVETKKTDQQAKLLKSKRKRPSETQGTVRRGSFTKTPLEETSSQFAKKVSQRLKNSLSKSHTVSSEKFKLSETQAPKKTHPRQVRRKMQHHKEPSSRQLNANIADEALKGVANLKQKWEEAKAVVSETKQKLDQLKSSKKPSKTQLKEAMIAFETAKERLKQVKHKPIQVDSYEIETWEVTVNHNGEVHKAHVKEFPSGSYHGAKVDGFRVRQQLLHNASKDWVLGTKKLEKKQKEQVLKRLDLLDQRFQLFYQKMLKSKNTKIFRSISKTHQFDEGYEIAYKNIHEEFLQKIAEYARDVEEIINLTAGEKVIDQDGLANAENEHVLNRDRPIIVNTFKYGPKTFVGIQTPARRILDSKGVRVNAKTIPSTIRNRSGLVNYVTSSFGVLEKGRVIILSEATRHSSYSAKSIEAAEIRQLVACRNVRSSLTDLAEKKLMALKNARALLPKTSQDSPLKVSLRTVHLLTTGIGDTLLRNTSGGKWIGDAEGTQLRDSAFALSVYKDAVFQVDLGKDFGKVWIKGDIKFINLGTNIGVTGTGLGKITMKKKAEQLINATGFVEFDDEFDFVIGRIKDDLNELSKGVGKEVKQGLRFLIKYTSLLEELQTSTSLRELIEEQSRKIKPLEKKLHGLANDAREEQNKATFQKHLEIKTRKQLEMYYEKLKYLQDVIGSKNQKIVNAKAELWMKNMDKVLEVQMKFNTAMGGLLKSDAVKGTNLETLLKSYQEIVNNSIQARDIYHGKKYKIPGYLNEFQSLCIETHQLIGNNVEFFCKSAEDRTGRVDDRVMERQVFKVMKGYFPRSESDYSIMNKTITPVVHQYSPSQDNTEQNSGARGEQVTGKANPEHPHLYNADRYHSQLAKKIFKDAKKLEGPSKDAMMVMKT